MGVGQRWGANLCFLSKDKKRGCQLQDWRSDQGEIPPPDTADEPVSRRWSRRSASSVLDTPQKLKVFEVLDEHGDFAPGGSVQPPSFEIRVFSVCRGFRGVIPPRDFRHEGVHLPCRVRLYDRFFIVGDLR
jgi:hypothetical protein